MSEPLARRRQPLILGLVFLFAWSCGGGGETGGTGTPADCDSVFYPLKTGNSWTYRVSPGDGSPAFMKTTTVGDLEPVGGEGSNATKMALKVVTLKGTDRTESWQALVDHAGGSGKAAVRYREIAYKTNGTVIDVDDQWTPYRLRFDESVDHTTSGATWDESFTEVKFNHTSQGVVRTEMVESQSWRVHAVDEMVIVPKGEFKTIRVSHTKAGVIKTFWFACGVGKVKETGGQTEELADHTVTWP